MRDLLKELNWRRKGPPLPRSVLNATQLVIDPEGSGRWRLPLAYRTFLSQMDGGRLGGGAFQAGGEVYVIEGFYAFADAANQGKRMRLAGRLPEGILPVAFGTNDRPIVFLELCDPGRVFLWPTSEAFPEPDGTPVLCGDFAAFLALLGNRGGVKVRQNIAQGLAATRSRSADGTSRSGRHASGQPPHAAASPAVIEVTAFTGVPHESKKRLYEAMRTCSNGQRLAVCLLFMSDLPNERHTLMDVERELRRIFPPSLPQGRMPDDYVDFGATAIRTLTSLEKKAVKEGRLTAADRIWCSPERGQWRNTDLGRRYALEALRERRVLVMFRGTPLNKEAQPLQPVVRDYMEEHEARAALEAQRVERQRALGEEVLRPRAGADGVASEGEHEPSWLSACRALVAELEALGPLAGEEAGTELRLRGSPTDTSAQLARLLSGREYAIERISICRVRMGCEVELTLRLTDRRSSSRSETTD